jgi:hypothetical protein
VTLTLSAFRRPPVDEVVDTQDHNLGLDSSKPAADTVDFVTHSTLTRLLDERDTDLKQLITSKFDSVMGAIDALRPPAVGPPGGTTSGTTSARRDLTEDSAFNNSLFRLPAHLFSGVVLLFFLVGHLRMVPLTDTYDYVR